MENTPVKGCSHSTWNLGLKSHCCFCDVSLQFLYTQFPKWSSTRVCCHGNRIHRGAAWHYPEFASVVLVFSLSPPTLSFLSEISS